MIPLHSANAPPPIRVRFAGSVRAVRPLQPSNVTSPIPVRVSGSVRAVRPLQSSNALEAIVFTPWGTAMCCTSDFSPSTPVTTLSIIDRLTTFDWVSEWVSEWVAWGKLKLGKCTMLMCTKRRDPDCVWVRVMSAKQVFVGIEGWLWQRVCDWCVRAYFKRRARVGVCVCVFVLIAYICLWAISKPKVQVRFNNRRGQ